MEQILIVDGRRYRWTNIYGHALCLEIRGCRENSAREVQVASPWSASKNKENPEILSIPRDWRLDESNLANRCMAPSPFESK
jgi:hypothetical protein